MRRVAVLVASLLASSCADETSGEASNGGAAGASGGAPSGGASGTSGAGGGSGAGGSGGLAGPPSLKRLGDTLELPTLAASAPKRFVDVAHDPTRDVYLVVHGNAAIGGAFVDADGKPKGAPFAIADTSAWTQAPRAAFAASSGSFLVTWHDTRENPNQPKLRARTVRWNGSSAELTSADIPLSSGATYQEMPPAIAYSATSDVFLVVWHGTPGDDLRAARVGPSGQALGGEVALTSDADWQSDAVLAWNPDRDELLLAYSFAAATAEIRVQRLKPDGTPVGAAQTLAQAKGTWLPQLAYAPSSQRYLLAWYDDGLKGRWLDADGAPAGAAFGVAPGYGAYDGFALARHAGVGAIAAVFHGPTDEDFALGMSDAAEQGPVLEATSSPGTQGHFNPRLAAHATRPEWLLVTARGFEAVVAQRIGIE